MEPTKKVNVTLGSLSPGDDTVRRWESIPAINDLIMDIGMTEMGQNDEIQTQIAEGEFLRDDDNKENFEFYENAQRITTQDLTTPETYSEHNVKPIGEGASSIVKNTRKRRRGDSMKNRGGDRYESECDNIPAWVRAINALRLSYWNTSKGRKVIKTRYIVPDTDGEISCYHMCDKKRPFVVRIMCSFFEPKKITIGYHGQKDKKCEFDIVHLDLVSAALTSILQGAKSKTINLSSRGEKLKMEMSNGFLHFYQTFPSGIKKIVQKNNMPAYLSPDDCGFNIPASEIDHLMEALSATFEFVKLKKDIDAQRKKVFMKGAFELKQRQSMSSSQFAIKLFEIYYKMDLAPPERYPISIVLPEYYKMFSHVL